MDKKASGQVAMLIVQIAVILAAVVIIVSMAMLIDNFKDKGMSIPTGALTKAKTGISMKEITGYSLDDDREDVEGFIITIKPSAGSDPIDLTRTRIFIHVGNKTASLSIIDGAAERNESGGFYTE